MQATNNLSGFEKNENVCIDSSIPVTKSFMKFCQSMKRDEVYKVQISSNELIIYIQLTWAKQQLRKLYNLQQQSPISTRCCPLNHLNSTIKKIRIYGKCIKMSASKENIFKTFLNDTKFRFASKHIHNQSGATTTTTKKELQFLDYNSDICILLSVLFYVFTVVIFLVSSTRAIAAMHISKQTSIFCFFFCVCKMHIWFYSFHNVQAKHFDFLH